MSLLQAFQILYGLPLACSSSTPCTSGDMGKLPCYGIRHPFHNLYNGQSSNVNSGHVLIG